jgi:glycosyltransferase involved in cell wall biosynthesis
MSDPIRIAHVAPQLETGGMERLLAEFARHAERHRVSLHFIALGKRGSIAGDIEACGWPVTALDAPPGARPWALFRLARMFHDQRIDIVHTHNTKPLLYAAPAALVARVRGVIHTRHGQRFGASRRQNIAFRIASRCADCMVCVSGDSARLCRQGGINAQSLHTIHNGIDSQRFAFTGPAPDGPAVYVGRLSPEKDIATLLRATAIVVAQCPTFRLQIAGSGSCSAELAALTESLHLGGNVQFLGEVRDVPPLLHGASGFVLPSLTEGLPLTVLEAMACGLPVVATRVGGTPEAVLEGNTGLLVSPREPAQLAAALLQIHTNPEMARQMGLAGRARVETHFDVRTMVASYESLYADLLQNKQTRAA